MSAYHYKLDKNGRRVLAGLSYDETTEFELLDARLALDAKPLPAADRSLPQDLRWLELFRKHEVAVHGTAA